jgi:hypothetical protein
LSENAATRRFSASNLNFIISPYLPSPLPTGVSDSLALVAMANARNGLPAASAAANAGAAPEKALSFGAVETIGRADEAADVRIQQANVSAIGGPLRRSPTPLVHSLAELAQEHQDQLRLVWNETGAAVPDITRDSIDIASSLSELSAA